MHFNIYIEIIGFLICKDLNIHIVMFIHLIVIDIRL